MPRIFDNIDQSLLPALRETLAISDRADFCVGYFNLRGWKQIDDGVEKWHGGPGQSCRLLVGMQKAPAEELREAIGLHHRTGEIDNSTAIRLKKHLAKEFKSQLEYGVPTNADEAGLRRLAAQIRAKKVTVKLFLRHQLHAKLYLLFRPDPITPKVGYLGSSNLTFAGLAQQGELNVDVVDQDSCNKLAKWFEDRWNDQWCLDISQELMEIIDASWARVEPPPPFHIYVKMAYHLSHEAQEGVREFDIPREINAKMFPFQRIAVKVAARHLDKRGGVLIGDVVGLGKTIMATAVARIFEIRDDLKTLILCPKNLVPMWEHYREEYGLQGKVLSISLAARELPDLRPYRLVLIDESHNLRNREGSRYQSIRAYIDSCKAKVILLSATPYNKGYFDLSSQLRLFIPDDADVGARPEQYLRELTAAGKLGQLQCAPRTLAAFERSSHADDWRELMKLFMVRRTRSFIQSNYATEDKAKGLYYLTLTDGTRSYFPKRVPKTLKFAIDDNDPADQYARLYSAQVVDTINALTLPRYGLGNYIHETPKAPPTTDERKIYDDLARAGTRLLGFCRTNLFKRLESGGYAFLQSLERHVLRNFVYLHALENKLPVPIGTQDSHLLDLRFTDVDTDLFTDEESEGEPEEPVAGTAAQLKARAAEIYTAYAGPMKRRFRWLKSERFQADLIRDLNADNKALLAVIERCGTWDPARDAKLQTLAERIRKKHPDQKVLVFTQFADTVHYLVEQLHALGVTHCAGVTGGSANPTDLARSFSPESNDCRNRVTPEQEIRVLVATDVLSEGQNLQDAAVVVNYDLPWAIIRLIQRAGRVDRIGQQAAEILCYSFSPAEGVEKIISLRARVSKRLRENAEVVGTDEEFFDDEKAGQFLRDLFTELSGSLDGGDDPNDVDLGSRAYQIWKNAITADPGLEKIIKALPDVVLSSKAATKDQYAGVLAYVRTAEGHDALAQLDRQGNVVSESQGAILDAAACEPNTPAVERLENHHELVQKGIDHIVAEELKSGGALGRKTGAKYRTYTRLSDYAQEVRGTLADTPALRATVEDIYKYPLRQAAIDTLNKLLRHGIGDADLAARVLELRDEGKLSVIHDDDEPQTPRIVCSMGLVRPG
jgi:superfamily II DNA or RNA helicase